MGALKVGTLTLYGRDVSSVFDLLGTKENGLTAALAYTLASSPALLALIQHRLLPHAQGQAMIQLEVRDKFGRTDLQIDTGDQLAVVEAKKGWLLPGSFQLQKYATRVKSRANSATGSSGGVLATLSESSARWAAHVQPATVGGVPVLHLPWTDVLQDLTMVRTTSRGAERAWLDQLANYLTEAINVLDPRDSMVWCVPLNKKFRHGGGKLSSVDYLEQQNTYFHPLAPQWRKSPPNFIGFRYGAHLQRISRVLSSQVVTPLRTAFSDIPLTPQTNGNWVVYKLGPPLPFDPKPVGHNYQNGRQEALLDQLLIRETFKEAVDETAAMLR